MESAWAITSTLGDFATSSMTCFRWRVMTKRSKPKRFAISAKGSSLTMALSIATRSKCLHAEHGFAIESNLLDVRCQERHTELEAVRLSTDSRQPLVRKGRDAAEAAPHQKHEGASKLGYDRLKNLPLEVLEMGR
jgi:hypothetical protein